MHFKKKKLYISFILSHDTVHKLERQNYFICIISFLFSFWILNHSSSFPLCLQGLYRTRNLLFLVKAEIWILLIFLKHWTMWQIFQSNITIFVKNRKSQQHWQQNLALGFSSILSDKWINLKKEGTYYLSSGWYALPKTEQDRSNISGTWDENFSRFENTFRKTLTSARVLLSRCT